MPIYYLTKYNSLSGDAYAEFNMFTVIINTFSNLKYYNLNL